jgi:lipoprotein NlpD
MRRLAALLLPVGLLMAAPVPALAAPAGPIVAWQYVVAPGDTLAAIARRMGVSLEELAAANGIPAPYAVRAGQVIKRPDPAGAPKVRATPRPAPAARPAPPPRPLPEAPVSRRREPGAPSLAWPTAGAVVTRFGATVRGLPANGIDLAAHAGMTVQAAAAGRVIYAGNEPERFGQLILIDHGGGWVTAYAYLGKVGVTEGQVVKARQVIARIGQSGEARRPLLHFELRKGNVPRDPAPYLPVRL